MTPDSIRSLIERIDSMVLRRDMVSHVCDARALLSDCKTALEDMAQQLDEARADAEEARTVVKDLFPGERGEGLRSLVIGVINERDDLRSGLMIPGAQECPKCKFALQKMVMRAADGAVGPMAQAPLEECPNGCGPLVGVTYEQGWREMTRAAEDQATRASKAEAALERMRSIWPHIEVGIKGRMHDPGSPACLRCRIEAVIGADSAEVAR